MPFIRIFGLINAFVVENVRQQRELERHEDVSPVLSSEGGLLHRMLASRFAKDMGFSDGELPALESTTEDANDFGAEALPIHSGEIYKMATYVAGGDPREDIEVIVQRWVARRFNPRYEPSEAACSAARLIGGWHRRGPLTALACIWQGRLNDAKALVGASVPPDLHVAYAPTALLPYIVKCLERMRQVAGDPTISSTLSAEMVVAGCLASPRFAFRTCKREIEVSFSGRPLPADTLVILPARRLGATGDGSSAFGSEDAARYPALRLIRRLLTRVWVASRDVYYPATRSVVEVTERNIQPMLARRSARVVVQHDQPSVALDPTLMQAVAAQAAALPPGGPDLASLKRTLPYGNDLGKQRKNQPASEDSRSQKRRARRPKHNDRTVPGPF
ncbi:MAG TPA: hypothetical protein VMG12_24740 [Polyangiaceae bacterium]|nr:hypothetical protein [Polyangiaceae bacterium]